LIHITEGLSAEEYCKKRKQARRHFNSGIAYINKEKETFLSYFSLHNFKKLPAGSRRKHSIYRCFECAENHQQIWIKKRGNKIFSDTPAKPNCALKSLKAVLDKTPTEITATVVDDLVKNVIRPVKEKLKQLTPSLRRCAEQSLSLPMMK